MTTELSTGVFDSEIIRLWRRHYNYREIAQRLPGNLSETHVSRRGYILGLYENHNASEHQIAKVAAERKAAKLASEARREPRHRD